MHNLGETIWLFSRVAITFFLLYAFIPSKIIRFDEKQAGLDGMDKFFISLIQANFVTIVLIHLLAAIRIYETFSLVLGYIAVVFIYFKIITRVRKKDSLEDKANPIARALDSMDSNGGAWNAVKNKIKARFKKTLSTLKSGMVRFIKNPIPAVLVAVFFAFGAFVRFSHSFSHLYYGASDAYVHLAWVKYIGNNVLYADGVYPLGYNMIISALEKIFFTDPHTIIRFIGGIGGFLIILSIYYVLRKYFKSSVIPALIGVAVYVATTELPVNVWRQMSALPLEYAMIFMLPGMHFLLTYFRTKENKFLYLAAQVLALTLLIHLYVSVFLVIGYLAVCIFYLPRFFSFKLLGKFAGVMTGAAVIGLLPIGAGLLSGIEMHGPSIDFILESAGRDPQARFNPFGYIESETGFLVMLAALLFAVIISLVGLFYNKKDNRQKALAGLAFAFTTLFVYIQYRSEEFGVPSLMETSRTGIFLGLLAAFTIAVAIGLLDIIPVHKIIKSILKAVAGITVFVLTVNISALGTLPEGAKLEYDEAAYSYMEIKKGYPALNWTIVSPVEQYPQVIGHGWHYELWEFVMDVTEEKPNELKIPTDYVFWFVEKYPLNSEVRITMEDALQPFPEITENLDDFYTVAEKRRIIQARAYFWLEDYMEKNDNVVIYRDTEHMRIYKLVQDGSNPINLVG